MKVYLIEKHGCVYSDALCILSKEDEAKSYASALQAIEDSKESTNGLISYEVLEFEVDQMP